MAFTIPKELVAQIEEAQAAHMELVSKLDDMGFRVMGAPFASSELVKTFLEFSPAEKVTTC